MPQTLEAIDHAKAAKVPIIVAINKIDKPDAQPERIKQQLADRGLLAEDWGGDTVMVPVSAKTQEQSRSAARNDSAGGRHAGSQGQSGSRPAMGTVLEAKLDRGRGPVATVLVRNGTLQRRRLLHLRLGVRQGARHVRRSRRADPRSRAVHAGGSAGSGIAARSRATTSRWSPTPPRPSRSSCTAKPRRAKRPWPRPAASRSNNCTSR